MSDELKFQQTVLSELASIHATLALLEDFYFRVESGGLTQQQKKRMASAAEALKQKKLRLLCSQAGVAYPPENPAR